VKTTEAAASLFEAPFKSLKDALNDNRYVIC
jgi:hypothetical protein